MLSQGTAKADVTYHIGGLLKKSLAVGHGWHDGIFQLQIEMQIPAVHLTFT
jgi:hypothetical protein